MEDYTIIHTLPGSDTFSLFDETLKEIYPVEMLPTKQLEGINQQFLQQVYIITKNEKPIGRCCLYSNPHLIYNDYRTACIGNFECINDQQVSSKLLTYVLSHAKKLGFEYMLGPMNGSTWDTYRLGVASTFPNFFLEPYYPAYYPELFSNNGFSKIARYVSNIDQENELNDQRIIEVEKRFIEQGISFRNIDLNHYETELDKLYDFCMLSFRSNFLFTPIDRSIFIEKYLKIKPYINPEYVTIAEDKGHNMIGFMFCLENFYDRKEKGIIIKTVAKLPSIRYGGMANVLATRFKNKAMLDGYKYIIHAFMIESNASKCLSTYFSGETIREYFLYGTRIH